MFRLMSMNEVRLGSLAFLHDGIPPPSLGSENRTDDDGQDPMGRWWVHNVRQESRYEQGGKRIRPVKPTLEGTQRVNQLKIDSSEGQEQLGLEV